MAIPLLDIYKDGDWYEPVTRLGTTICYRQVKWKYHFRVADPKCIKCGNVIIDDNHRYTHKGRTYCHQCMTKILKRW